MAQSRVLRGADCKIFIAGKLYPAAQSLTYTINYGEQEIYGIDSQFPQEIVPTRVSVVGSITGIKVKSDGGLIAADIRAKISKILSSPYTSLKIQDRHTGEDLLWLPQMKVTSETLQMQAKGVVTISFNFKGIIPYNTLDLDSKEL